MKSKMKRHLRRLIPQSKRARRALFVTLVATVGVTTVLLTKAAPPTASVDICEDTPLQGNAFIGHDHPNTACGHYVSFGFDPPTNVSTALTKVAGGVTAPVDMQSTKVSGDNRLFIVSQMGKIHISNLDGSNVTNSVFLDLTSRVRSGGEQGLLGLVFDPNYAQNGYFYVAYTTNANRGTFNGQVVGEEDMVISRFTRSSANVADPNSELVILGYDDPRSNHNGGGLQFGPDGFLYISIGDGGGADDNNTQNCAYGNGQCLSTYMGKILRINVAGASASQRYTIPAGNPFASTSGAKPEIWHYGLRNPWRFSFDRANGNMLIGDVGQNNYEEVNFAAAGQSGRNFGWRCYEGPSVFNTSGNANCNTPSNFVSPIYAYPHNDDNQFIGCSITGGYVYRGTQHPELGGTYIFSDYCTSKLWYLTKGTNNVWTRGATVETGFPDNSVTSLGEDRNGEIYIAIVSGNVYRIDVSH
jgi:glucose/arabinose dehydrogenase